MPGNKPDCSKCVYEQETADYHVCNEIPVCGFKPRQPETEKRVFEGIVGDDSYAGICFGDNKKLSLNIVPETEDEERAWRKLLNMRVRITVEVLK